MVKYVYPILPSIYTTPFIRYAGSGLANSLFVFARAWLIAKQNVLELINPTWLNFDPVQWKLWSKDKRTYYNIFHDVGKRGLSKLWLLTTGKKITEDDFFFNKSIQGDILIVRNMVGFEPLRGYSSEFREALYDICKNKIIQPLSSFDFSKSIALHVRLGDYGNRSLPINYYKRIVQQIHLNLPQYKFLLFSDGSDTQLQELTSLTYVNRVYFGSSLSDMLAISCCEALIGSHSTFTDWGGVFFAKSNDTSRNSTLWQFFGRPN